MQKCLLIANKTTRISEYLERRALYEVVEERQSLSTISIESMDIIDVDLLLFIYYESDDNGLGFRSDMNALRKLLACPFFNVDSAVFILVDDKNPLREDLIRTAVRTSSLTEDKIEIIKHEGSLMLEHVVKYLSGNASGSDTSSSYTTVYITEAGTEEKDRYANVNNGVKAILPILTDNAQMYNHRARAEALSSGRVLVEHTNVPKMTRDFSDVSYEKSNEMRGYVFSGVDYSGYEKSVKYYAEYCNRIGQRVMIVNIGTKWNIADVVPDCEVINLTTMRQHNVIANMSVGIDISFSSLWYFVEFIDNIPGIDAYIFLVPRELFETACNIVSQLCDKVKCCFVTHFTDEAVRDYLREGIKSDTVFLSEMAMTERFDIKKYTEDFHGSIVAYFPQDTVDYSDFYSLVEGGA